MKITITMPHADEDSDEQVEFPAKYEVCGACRGTGTQLCEGLRGADVTEDLREDPDFAEDYRAGVYDVQCERCGGRTTELVVDVDRLTPEQKARWDSHLQYLAICRADRDEDRHTRFMESGGY
jgi:hypothetical protein